MSKSSGIGFLLFRDPEEGEPFQNGVQTNYEQTNKQLNKSDIKSSEP